MIIKLFLQFLLSVLGVLLSPISFVNHGIGNILEGSVFITLVRFANFIFDENLITLAVDLLIMWFSLFLLRPIINLVRNRS